VQVGSFCQTNLTTLKLHVPPTRHATVGERAFGVFAAHVWNGLPSDVIKSPSPSNNGSRHGSSAARLISDSLTPVHNLRDTVVGFIFASLKLLKFY